MGNIRGESIESAMEYISDALRDISADLTREARAEQERVKRGELQLPSAAEVEAFLAHRLGWGRAGCTVSLCRFGVRHGLALLGSWRRGRRRAATDSCCPVCAWRWRLRPTLNFRRQTWRRARPH